MESINYQEKMAGALLGFALGGPVGCHLRMLKRQQASKGPRHTEQKIVFSNIIIIINTASQ